MEKNRSMKRSETSTEQTEIKGKMKYQEKE